MNKWWNWVLGIALFCLLFIAIPLSFTAPKNPEEMKLKFDAYIEKFNKSYKNNPEEYKMRFQHFLTSIQEIERLNSESRGPEQYRARYGPTKLSDMSPTEYKDLHLSDEKLTKLPGAYDRSWRKNRERVSYHVEKSYETLNKNEILSRRKRASLPLQVDWRVKGAVGGVKNQGMCGACWAFSTVGAMESMAAINTGKLTTLSVQEVIDCARLGNQGCAGGDICLLLDWLMITKTPVEVEKNYPLQLTDGVCKVKKNATGIKLTSFTCDDFVGAEQKIIEALALHGPVVVAVNALTWQNYLGGVIQYHCSGAVMDLNHAVQLVGYDLTADVPYYIAKNSWGTDFGLNGYLNLAIGTNICGLANEVATVDVA
ncbi:unnamed protein product [Diatraea saccharalis]|uniref:Cathepsin O n=1 Tax=Diatraea saccharalis TaxID=40085 RepID=A0A9N9QPS3_9NEOP|nr:unnamed protein product [Diatraea saccharalis]